MDAEQDLARRAGLLESLRRRSGPVVALALLLESAIALPFAHVHPDALRGVPESALLAVCLAVAFLLGPGAGVALTVPAAALAVGLLDVDAGAMTLIWLLLAALAGVAGRQQHELDVERATLQRLTAALSEAPTPDAVARAAVEHGRLALGAVRGMVVLRDRQGSALEVLAEEDRAAPDSATQRGRRLSPAARLPIAEAVRDDAPVLVLAPARGARRPRRGADTPTGSGALVALPLRVGGEAIGAVELGFDEPRLSRGRLSLLDALARALAQALDRARLFEAEQHARAAAERDALEQQVLQLLTRRVAAGMDPTELFALVAEQSAFLLGLSVGFVARYDGPDAGVTMAHWARRPRPDHPAPGTHFALEPGMTMHEVRRTGRPARADAPLPSRDDPDLTARVAAPVVVAGRPWGIVMAAGPDPTRLSADAGERLARFADLVGVAVTTAHQREQLEARASADALTGLANHRVLHERLRSELDRARRHGRALSLALLDVDHFKRINDTHGHLAGDAVLVELARRLQGEARSGELVARVGGEEFAWVLPETDRLGAYAAAERARRAVTAAAFPGVGRVTISAGLCDLAHAETAEELYRLADAALYWAKAHGRDRAFAYTPEVVRELSAQEAADRLRADKVVTGLRALARAIDAKDPTTLLHSERVAELALRLAMAAGWSPARADLLHQAALAHDVGKIAVPDAILTKPSRLTPDEFAQVRGHAELGAQIVAEILTSEQVAWVRRHHERPDGTGYPDGLAEQDISDGAQLLAVADAWDVMTGERPYSPAVPSDDALRECRLLVGRQFTAAAVEALARVMRPEPVESLDAAAG